LIAFIDRIATETQTEANRNSKSLFSTVKATNNTFEMARVLPQTHTDTYGNEKLLEIRLN